MANPFDPAESRTVNIDVAANIAAFNTLLASVLNALFAADKAVTTDERQKLEGFLAHNAGLAASLLPAGHPYLAAPPVAN